MRLPCLRPGHDGAGAPPFSRSRQAGTPGALRGGAGSPQVPPGAKDAALTLALADRKAGIGPDWRPGIAGARKAQVLSASDDRATNCFGPEFKAAIVLPVP